MKYIDSDKLYKKLDKLMAQYAKSEEDMDAEGYTDFATYYQGKRKVCSEALDIITSLQQEQPDVEEDFFFDEVLKVYDDNNKLPPWSEEELTMLEIIAQHFYELGMSVMRERITNPEYNQKVIEEMKSEYPMDKANAKKED